MPVVRGMSCSSRPCSELFALWTMTQISVPPPHEFDPGRIGAADERVGDPLRDRRDDGEPHEPLRLPGAMGCGQPDDAQSGFSTQPPVAARDGLRRDAQDGADPRERGAAVDLERVDEGVVKLVEHGLILH